MDEEVPSVSGRRAPQNKRALDATRMVDPQLPLYRFVMMPTVCRIKIMSGQGILLSREGTPCRDAVAIV